ncbi:HTH domain-containing protein [Labilibaculum euxinus]
MEYKTMTRQEFADKLSISRSTLHRKIAIINKGSQNPIPPYVLLLEEEVKYLHEKIKELYKQESGSK